MTGGGVNNCSSLSPSEKKENKYTNEDLKTMQGWSLERKIQVTQTRILEWYQKWDGKVYVSFSGGKDSTVLLDLARRIDKNIPGVFCDTGLEYPEIREFVKTFNNVEFIYPVVWDRHKREYVRTNFKKVISESGYPVISKEVSQIIEEARRHETTGKYIYRIEKLNGTALDKNGNLSQYNCPQWKYLLDSDFKISAKCCDRMKKAPAKKYQRETGRYPIVATMASESRLRKQQWIRHGCNIFDSNKPISKPLSFWTEQDVLAYIKEYNLPFASVYGEIKQDEKGKYYTTGCSRTGCVFCAYGAHLEKEPNRFQRLKQTHPKLWNYCMKSVAEGGLGMKEVLEYIGVKIE